MTAMSAEMKFCIALCVAVVLAIAIAIIALSTGKNKDQINTLSDQINTLSDQIKDNQQQITSLTSQVSTLQQGIGTINGDLNISGNLKVQGQTSLFGDTLINNINYNPDDHSNYDNANDFKTASYSVQFLGGWTSPVSGTIEYDGTNFNILGKQTVTGDIVATGKISNG